MQNFQMVRRIRFVQPVRIPDVAARMHCFCAIQKSNNLNPLHICQRFEDFDALFILVRLFDSHKTILKRRFLFVNDRKQLLENGHPLANRIQARMRPRIKLIDAQHFGNHQSLVANQLLNLPIAVKFIRNPMQEAYPPYFFPLHRCEQLLQMSAQLLSRREDMAASQTIIFHMRPPCRIEKCFRIQNPLAKY